MARGAAIATFLHERLPLTLRPELPTPFPVRQGLDCVGWRTWWNRRLSRRRTLGNLWARLATAALGLRSRALPCASYAFTAGFPVWLSDVHTSRAVRQGWIVVQPRPALVPLHPGYTLREAAPVPVPQGGCRRRVCPLGGLSRPPRRSQGVHEERPWGTAR